MLLLQDVNWFYWKQSGLKNTTTTTKVFFLRVVEKINSQLVTGREREEQHDNHLIEKDRTVLPWALATCYNSQWSHLDSTVKLNFMCQQSNLKLLSRCQLHICHVSDQQRCFSRAVADSLLGMLFFRALCDECGGLQGLKKPSLLALQVMDSVYLCGWFFFIQNVSCKYWGLSKKPGGSYWIWGFVENTFKKGWYFGSLVSD